MSAKRRARLIAELADMLREPDGRELDLRIASAELRSAACILQAHRAHGGPPGDRPYPGAEHVRAIVERLADFTPDERRAAVADALASLRQPGPQPAEPQVQALCEVLAIVRAAWPAGAPVDGLVPPADEVSAKAAADAIAAARRYSGPPCSPQDGVNSSRN